MSRRPRERGAAAVEMAIVLPLLLLVIGGLVDFGRAYYYKTVSANAAREGARMVAMGYSTNDATVRVDSAVGTLPTGMNSTKSYATCPSFANVGTATVTITGFNWTVLNVVPSFFGGSVPVPTLSSTGSMRCNG
jgi:Flp pilus assembly protein TadG